MATFEKGGQVSLSREKDPVVWPTIRTDHVFREPYAGWGADRACRGLPAEWFDVDQEDRSPEDFLADLETGERVCLDCPLAVECRDQARRCKARGLFGAVVTTESGTAWPVDLWVQMRTGGGKAQKKKAPEVRRCAWTECGRPFTVSPKKPRQKYCSRPCGWTASKSQRVATLENHRPSPTALAS